MDYPNNNPHCGIDSNQWCAYCGKQGAKKSPCILCGDSGEVLQVAKRVIGYTLFSPNESIDEVIIPCPICRGKNGTR